MIQKGRFSSPFFYIKPKLPVLPVNSVLYHYYLLIAWLFAAPRDFANKRSRPPSANTNHPTNNDYEALIEELFRTHYAALCRAVYPIVRDQDTAEDIVQDVFLKIWRSKTALDTQQSVKAYLFRAAINTALNFLEKNHRTTPWDETLTEQYASNSTEEGIAYQETAQKVANALEKLPPKCRVVFSLSRFEEMSYAEIAQHLSISVKAVEKHMGKALKIMRAYVYDQ